MHRSLDHNDNFRKFKMADGRHFENSFISISQSELCDFDHIWYAGANFHLWLFDKKIEFFSNSRWRTDAILKVVFWLYIGALLADRREIRKGDEESHANTGHVPILQFSKIQDGGRPPF